MSTKHVECRHRFQVLSHLNSCDKGMTKNFRDEQTQKATKFQTFDKRKCQVRLSGQSVLRLAVGSQQVLAFLYDTHLLNKLADIVAINLPVN